MLRSLVDLLKKQVTSGVVLDQNDRQIIDLLTSCIRTNNLAKKLPLFSVY